MDCAHTECSQACPRKYAKRMQEDMTLSNLRVLISFMAMKFSETPILARFGCAKTQNHPAWRSLALASSAKLLRELLIKWNQIEVVMTLFGCSDHSTNFRTIGSNHTICGQCSSCCSSLVCHYAHHDACAWGQARRSFLVQVIESEPFSSRQTTAKNFRIFNTTQRKVLDFCKG